MKKQLAVLASLTLALATAQAVTIVEWGATGSTCIRNDDTSTGDSLRLAITATTDGVTDASGKGVFFWKQAGNGSDYGFLNDLDSGDVEVTGFTMELKGGGQGLIRDARFFIQQGSDYFISNDLITGTEIGATYTSLSLAPALTGWYGYTPTTDLRVIGSGTTLASLSGVTGVGYYLDWYDSSPSTTGSGRTAEVRYFNVTGDLIPEPSALLLALSGLGGVCLLRRRR